MTKTILDLLHEGKTQYYTYSLATIEPDGDHEIYRNIVDMTEWLLNPETLEKDLAGIQQIYPGMDSGWYSLIVQCTEQYVGEYAPSIEIFFFAGNYDAWKQVPESVHRYIRIEQYTRCSGWRTLQNSKTVHEFFNQDESFKIQFPVIASCYFNA
jgi:hypothetical protein